MRKFLYLYPTLAVILKQMRNIEEIEGDWRSFEEFGKKFVSRILNRDRGLKSPLVTKKVKNVIFIINLTFLFDKCIAQRYNKSNRILLDRGAESKSTSRRGIAETKERVTAEV